MQIEAQLEQKGKLIYHSIVEALDLEQALTRLEKYVMMERLNELGECLLRVKCYAGTFAAIPIDLSNFSAFTYDAIMKGKK